MKEQLHSRISIYAIFLFIAKFTFSQPTLLKDIYSGAKSSMEQVVFTKIGDKLIFSADDGIHGREGWLTDGTTSGTIRRTENTVNFIDTLYTVGGNGLFKTNGTEINYIFANLGFNRVSRVTEVNGTWFFVANIDAYNLEELWKSDGTEAGTVVVKKFRPNSVNDSYTTNLIASPDGTELFFTANNGSGFALWKSDGTTTGTVIVKYFTKTPQNRFGNFINYNDETYFTAYDPKGREGFWKTDGTEAGTTLVYQNLGFGSISQNQIIVYKDKIYFGANNSSEYGNELWVSDGTTGGTNLFYETNPGASEGFPGSFKIVNDLLVFLANTDLNGNELWVTNGSESGTYMLKDVHPGTDSGFLGGDDIKKLNKFFFTGFDGKQRMLWETDGTTVGTIPLYDISESDLDMTSSFGYINNTLIFLKETIANGKELWSFNATLSVDVVQNKNKISVYPNPVSNILTIEYPFSDNLQLKVINQLGQLVLKQNQDASLKSLDVSKLSKGLYFLNIDSESGNSHTIKFIKN